MLRHIQNDSMSHTPFQSDSSPIFGLRLNIGIASRDSVACCRVMACVGVQPRSHSVLGWLATTQHVRIGYPSVLQPALISCRSSGLPDFFLFFICLFFIFIFLFMPGMVCVGVCCHRPQRTCIPMHDPYLSRVFRPFGLHRISGEYFRAGIPILWYYS